ncbi:hypothetical protein [Kitasatospora sp. NPDC057015]|uniref:hypothetical protein n=1 Tax=Kitasatospora sp. NPDC057015 TaxID=3346001 RepID=UPI0036381073
MTEELRDLLRTSAEAHRPDRARMLARVERGMTGPGPAVRGRHRERGRALSWPRVVLAAMATAGAVTVGSLAVAAIVHVPDPPQQAVTAAPATSRSETVSPTASPSPSPSPSASPSASQSIAPHEPGRTPERAVTGSPAPSPSSSTSASPFAGHPSASSTVRSHTTDGPLWADGSVDPHSIDDWAQSNVTLRTSSPLTALTVELRIALTDGVKNAGSWQTRPAADFDVSVREDGGFLLYRWTLKPGRTVPVGQHVFAGQYGHATGGRDAKDDTYRADATTAAGRPAVWGDFARTG